MYGFREFCDAGGLLCYGTNLQGSISPLRYFIDKILKGTKPGDIPIEEPITFELIVNNRVAKSFDLTLPMSVLISADELIESPMPILSLGIQQHRNAEAVDSIAHLARRSSARLQVHALE